MVAVIGDDIRNRAEESSHGKLLAVHGVDHLVDGVLVGGVRVDGQAGTGVGPAASVLGIIPLDLGVGRGGVLLQRRQGDVLIAKRVAEIAVIGPTEGDTSQRGLAVTDGLRSVLRGVAGEHILRDKALGHESVQVGDDVLERVGGVIALNLAVVHIIALFGSAAAHEGGDHAFGVHQHQRAPQTEAEAADIHRHLISLAIAVRILGLECIEHVLELVPSGRHLEAQFVQPGLVDEHVGAGDLVAFASIGGQHGDLRAVGNVLRSARLGLEELLDVRHLVQMRLEILEVGAVLGRVDHAEQAQADVGEFAGGHLGALLLAPSVVRDFLPLDGAIAGGFQILGVLGVLHRMVGHVATNQNIDDWLAVLVCGGLLVAAGGKRRDHSRDCSY